jgi:hypothetical protein
MVFVAYLYRSSPGVVASCTRTVALSFSRSAMTFETTPQPDALPSYAWDFPSRDPHLTTGASGRGPRSAGQNPRREFSPAEELLEARVLPLAVAPRAAKQKTPAAAFDAIACRTDPGGTEDRAGSRSLLLAHPRKPFGRRRRPSGRRSRPLRVARAERGPRLLLSGEPPFRGADGRPAPAAAEQCAPFMLEVRRRALSVGGTAPRVASVQPGRS